MFSPSMNVDTFLCGKRGQAASAPASQSSLSTAAMPSIVSSNAAVAPPPEPPVPAPPVPAPPVPAPPVPAPPVPAPPVAAPPLLVPPLAVPPLDVPPLLVPPLAVPPEAPPLPTVPPDAGAPPVPMGGVVVLEQALSPERPSEARPIKDKARAIVFLGRNMGRNLRQRVPSASTPSAAGKSG